MVGGEEGAFGMWSLGAQLVRLLAEATSKKVVKRVVVELSRLFGNAWGSVAKRLAQA